MDRESENYQTNMKKEKITIRAGIKALWRHLKPFKRELIILSLLGVVSAIANGFIPFITGRFFDALIAIAAGKEQGGAIPLWASILGIWAFIQLVANNIDWIADRLRRSVDTKMHLSIQANGFIHLLKLPMSFHKSVQINEAIEEINKLGWRASAIFRNMIVIAPQLLSILIGITLAASINTTLAGVLALGVLVYVVLLLYVLRPIAAIDEAAHKLWNRGWSDATASVLQVESVKQASAEEYESERIHTNLMVKTCKIWQSLENNWSNISFFQRIIVFATQLTVFIFSVQFVGRGVISIGELVALNGYALMFFGPFVQLGHSWQVIQNGLTSAVQAEEVYAEPEEDYVPQHAATLNSIRGAVDFNDVSFSYAPNQPEILKKVNFSVEPGEVVAFVGKTGVGKSTAISLISAYYFPTEGAVSIDGIDTRNINLTQLRKQIAVVPQEVALFNDTIAANIRYGVSGVSKDAIKEVAKEAHISEFIDTLPDGYNTIVGERGIKLSVGQKQRVAIARAILRDPKILILDEPTSALDAHTEQLISESFERLMEGRTTFIIAHRLSTVRKAGKIFVFEGGRIIETGKHSELIKIENGVYRRLYEYQVGLHD